MKAKGTTTRRTKAPAAKKSVPCKNSPSCFTCPLKDCVMWESIITKTYQRHDNSGGNK